MLASSRGTKRKINHENSGSLWHKRLGHISKQRIERLVFEGISNDIDLIEFNVCINCIKGKQNKAKKIGAHRSSDVLELVHTNICGSFPKPSWNSQQYFTSFIDEYSRYGYLYLIHEKSEALDMFKIFKVKVENMLNKRIKNA